MTRSMCIAVIISWVVAYILAKRYGVESKSMAFVWAFFVGPLGLMIGCFMLIVLFGAFNPLGTIGTL